MVTLREGVTPPSLLLLNDQWQVAHELRVISFKGGIVLNEPGEAEAMVYLGIDSADKLNEKLHAWATVVLQANGEYLWGGYIVKRSRATSAPQIRLALREWSGWLDRVWTTGPPDFDFPSSVDIEYPEPGDALPPEGNDGSLIIWDRMSRASSLLPRTQTFGPFTSAEGVVTPEWTESVEMVPPLHLGYAPSPSGVAVEADFYDQNYEDSPRTILAEVDEIAEAGVEWSMTWEEKPDGSLYPQLHTAEYDPTAPPSAWINVGEDVAGMEIEWDSEPQSTRVRLIAAYGLSADREAPPSLEAPPLWQVRSYERLGINSATDAEAQVLADDLVEHIIVHTKRQILLADNVEIIGLTNAYSLGQVVAVVVENDVDGPNLEGLDFVGRIQKIEWTLDAGTRTTSLTMAAPTNEAFIPTSLGRKTPRKPSESLPPPFLPPYDPVEYMKSLEKRVKALESKRSDRKWATPNPNN